MVKGLVIQPFLMLYYSFVTDAFFSVLTLLCGALCHPEAHVSSTALYFSCLPKFLSVV